MRTGTLDNPPCYYQMQDCAANYGGVCLALQSTRFKRGYCPFYKSRSGVQIIPDYFYVAFAGEITSIYGLGVWDDIDYIGPENGVVQALKMTCRKLNLMWIYRKYDAMEWYDSDVYLGKLVDKAKKAITNMERGNNAYYRYLLNGI
jgi:hypothetical protein